MIVERLERPLSGVVDLTTGKDHARISGDDDDSGMQHMLMAAVREAEDQAQIALRSQAVRVTLEAWPRCHTFRLPIVPMLDLDSVTVTADGLPFEDFATITGQRPELRLTGARPVGQIVVEYVAGFGDQPDDMPHDLRLAIMDQAACYYDARGPADRRVQAFSPHFARIIARYRGVRA